jgi:SAM-dependent methyltransferase
VAGDYARWGSGVLAGLPWAARGHRGRFEFWGRRYAYRYHPYKFSWVTERAVEVPIAQAVVDEYRGRRILEVGNVLTHYGPADHTIVDKYEPAAGVRNLDVFELESLGRFDLVVAISTIEHVGRDEEPQDPTKSPEALCALRRSVAPGGRLLLTVPVGYHLGLDAAIRGGEFSFERTGALRRVGQTRWRETEPDAVWGTPYDFLLYSSRAVFVGLLGPE